MIGGDDQFLTDTPRIAAFETPEAREARLRWLDRYFEQPICRACSSATSPRSDLPLTLTYSPPRGDGAFGPIGHGGAPSVQLLSEAFVELLTPPERERLILRPAIRPGRGRIFHELIGPEGPPLVASSALKHDGWRCPDCGYRFWSYWIEELPIQLFVARADLPPEPDGVFTVGRAPEIRLAVTSARWRELVGRKGTRGFASLPLGVVPDRELVRDPELRLYNGWRR